MGQRIDRQRLLQLVGRIAPRMAGATVRERFVAAFGALLGIGITGFVCGLVTGLETGLPLLVAPMGASAVLLFAVPSSPLAQPWAVIGGNTLSALTAISVIHLVAQPLVAAAIAVGLALAVMALTRSLHPPGGAAALLVALMGPEGPAGSVLFAMLPVALNSTLLVLSAVAFHRFSGHAYPHLPPLAPASPHGTADPPPQQRGAPSEADIDTALGRSGEIFDIAKSDLTRLIREAEWAAVERRHDVPRCADVMSRDVLAIAPDASLSEVRARLLDRNLRIIPVIGDDRKVAGVVGLRDLQKSGDEVRNVMRPATLARPHDSVLRLIDPFTDGHSHAAVIADDQGRLVGLVTQTDLIAVLASLAITRQTGDG